MPGRRRQVNRRSYVVLKEIGNAAAKLFVVRGYRATTLQDVAGQLGISKPALYHYIDSKEDLLRLIYQETLQEGAASLRELVDSPLPPAEKLRGFLRSHLERIVAKPAAVALTFQTDADLPPDLLDAIAERKREIDELMTQIIVEGVAAGEMSTPDPKVAAFGILGMCNWTYRWYRPDGRLTPRQIADLFADLVLVRLRGAGGDGASLATTPAAHLDAMRRHLDAMDVLLASPAKSSSA